MLLVTIDTLRVDALGAYDNASSATPFDQLALEGTLFDPAMNQTTATGPSFASIMTSRYPNEVGFLHGTMPLRDEYRPLAEVFGAPGLDPRRGRFENLHRLEQEPAKAALTEALQAIR